MCRRRGTETRGSRDWCRWGVPAQFPQGSWRPANSPQLRTFRTPSLAQSKFTLFGVCTHLSLRAMMQDALLKRRGVAARRVINCQMCCWRRPWPPDTRCSDNFILKCFWFRYLARANLSPSGRWQGCCGCTASAPRREVDQLCTKFKTPRRGGVYLTSASGCRPTRCMALGPRTSRRILPH